MDTNKKQISEIMTRTVCQVTTEQTVAQILALMNRNSVSSVLVVEDGMTLGIVTERDVVRALHRNTNIGKLGCADLMQSPVVTLEESMTCLDAYHLMAGRGIRHLAVVDAAGLVVGIASEGDLMRDFGIEYYLNFKSVGDVMSENFCKLPAWGIVADAVAQMVERRQSCAVVVSDAGEPLGIITERDVVRLCHAHARPEQLLLRKTMHSPVSTARPHDHLHEAVKRMADAKIRRLVVTNDAGAACGLLTHHEIVLGLEGDYVNWLREVVEMQSRELQKSRQLIDEKLLLDNILRSASGTAVIATDTACCVSYCSPAIAVVLGIRCDEVAGGDLREILAHLGWLEAREILNETSLADGQAQHHELHDLSVDLQVSLLLDGNDEPQGFLVLAQKA